MRTVLALLLLQTWTDPFGLEADRDRAQLEELERELEWERIDREDADRRERLRRARDERKRIGPRLGSPPERLGD